MGYRKKLRMLGVILTAAFLLATYACTKKPQTIDISDIEEIVEDTVAENTTEDNTQTEDSNPSDNEGEKTEEEDEYPGLKVVHLNRPYNITVPAEPVKEDNSDIETADVVIFSDGVELHYEHMEIKYAPLDENYKYNAYDVSDMIVEIMTKAGYEEPFTDIMEIESEDEHYPSGKTSTRISGYLNPDDADKTSIEIQIIEFETIEEANQRFEDLADQYNSYGKIDFSYKPEENSRTLSNFFLKMPSQGNSLQAFISQKGNTVISVASFFFAAPRFGADAETPKPVYDLNTLEDIMTALELPYSIFYED